MSTAVRPESAQRPLHFDLFSTKGNLPDKVRQQASLIFDQFTFGPDLHRPIFAADVAHLLRIQEINVWPVDEHGESEAHAHLEIVVEDNLANAYGTLHGACAAYLIDIATSVPLAVIGLVQGRDGMGMSQSLDIIYHTAAPKGTPLVVIAKVITARSRIMTASCQIRHKQSGKLFVSGIHTKRSMPIPDFSRRDKVAERSRL